jgi:Endodeoxyribonuclease RusA
MTPKATNASKTAKPAAAKKTPKKNILAGERKEVGKTKGEAADVAVAVHPPPMFIGNSEAFFKITGKPTTMYRPKSGQGRTYSPSGNEVKKLCKQLQQLLNVADPSVLPDGHETLFEPGKSIACEANFFVHQGVGRIADIDNLLKFVLDVMNKSIWNDDRQVNRIVANKIKVATKEEQRTEVHVTLIE